MTTKNISFSPDLVGAFSSGLCLIHCLITPFIFLAQSCSTSCCADAPVGWRMIDYIFLGVSFFAVIHSGKNTSKNWIKIGLWVAWVATFLTILTESALLLYLPKQLLYIPALSLIVIHLYNQRYCQCKNDNCCIEGI